MPRSLPLLLLVALLCNSTAMPEHSNRQGKDYALFFAVDQYDHLADLSNPVRNANEIAKELQENYGFETEVVANPTREQIEQKIEQYQDDFRLGRKAQDGQLLIFFSGHGVKRSKAGYFMTTKAERGIEGIDYNYWRDEIDRIDCQHILVMIDACHSAFFDPDFEPSKGDEKRSFGRAGESDTDVVLLRHESLRARKLITSDGTGNQTPDRSSFTREFLRALRNSQSGQYLTDLDLMGRYLNYASPQPGSGEFGRDQAESYFIFFPKQVDRRDQRADLTAWRSAQNTNTCASYRDYKNSFPNGDFISLANEQLAACDTEERELAAWSTAERTNTRAGYEAFIRDFPNSDYIPLARRKLSSPFFASTGSSTARSSEVSPDSMIFIKGGTFQMGDIFGDGDEKPVHSVTLDDFYLANTEVTNAGFVRFLNEEGNQNQGGTEWYKIRSTYANISGGDNSFFVDAGYDEHPVMVVSWYAAIQYCNWLSRKHGLTSVYNISDKKISPNWNHNGYRLPTEAEWEYAARSRGKSERWAGTSHQNQLGLYSNTFGDQDRYAKTAPVGSFQANELGLFDMTGNAWEFCWDWYSISHNGGFSIDNPKGPNTGSNRVIRGGSWSLIPKFCRISDRYYVRPSARNSDVGFRLARSF